MPAFRNVNTTRARRSRRLSKQEPRNYGEDEWELESYQLMYPSPGPESITPHQFDHGGLSQSPQLPYPSLPEPSSLSSPNLSPNGRKSHSRRRQEGHIPRPPNAFIIFRSHMWDQQKGNLIADERNHRNVSRIAGECWNQLPDHEREKYKQLARDQKRRHIQQHPDYKYTPVFRKERPLKRKVKRDSAGEEKRCKQVARRIKVESPRTPDLCPDHSPSPSERDFVPTEQIPHLDLAAFSKEVKVEEYDTQLRPPSYSYIDEQFGVKPEAISFVKHAFLPSMQRTDEGMITDQTSDSSFKYSTDPLCPINDSVEFRINPFNFSALTSELEAAALERLRGEGIPPNAMIEPIPTLSSGSTSSENDFFPEWFQMNY